MAQLVEDAPHAAPNCAFRNSLRPRLRWISSQKSVRQHCKEDGAERKVVGEASLRSFRRCSNMHGAPGNSNSGPRNETSVFSARLLPIPSSRLLATSESRCEMAISTRESGCP